MKYLCIILLAIIGSSMLFGFDFPAEIDDNLQGRLSINYEKNVKIINQRLWLLYYDVTSSPQMSSLKLAREQSDGSFEVTSLESMTVNSGAAMMLDCTFCVTDEDVTIFYKKPGYNYELSVYKIHSDDLMETWSYEGELWQYDNVQELELVNHEDDQVLVLLQNDHSGIQGINALYYEYGCDESLYGDFVVWGPVHSKDDIVIRHAGTGTNNGWPTFHELVTTEGRIIDGATGNPAILSAPMEDIFLGGFMEEVICDFTLPEELNLNQSFNLSNSLNRDIIFIEIDGTISICRYGDYINETDTLTVYNSFPDTEYILDIGDSLWTNTVDAPRIEWDDTTFPLNVVNSAVTVYCDVWIEGEVSGKQTWNCKEDVYITNDLLYSDTTPGTEPSLLSPNVLWLNSDKNIYIKYKNFNPDIQQIQDDNCDGIYIYGMLTALGMPAQTGMDQEYSAGGLRAEYLHPHGSTPPFTLTYPNGNEWDIAYPDLHKYVYSDPAFFTGDPGFIMHSNGRPTGFPSCGFPYEDPEYGDGINTPYGTDYPWYNPIYPESSDDIVFIRGSIELWGGLYERRFHNIYCTGGDSRFHYANTWDPESHRFGGIHSPSGYDLKLNYDYRFLYSNTIIPNFTENLLDTNYGLTILSSDNGGVSFQQNENHFWESESNTGLNAMLLDVDNDKLGILYPVFDGLRSHVYHLDSHYLETEDIDLQITQKVSNLRMIDEAFYFTDDQNIYEWEFGDLEILSEFGDIEFYDFEYLNDFPLTWESYWQGNELRFSFGIANDYWNFDYVGEDTFEENYEIDEGNLHDVNIAWDSSRRAKLMLHTVNNWGEGFYLSNGYIENITPVIEDEANKVLNLVVYPNPFYSNEMRNSINIEYSLKNYDEGKIELYNIKGQQIAKWQTEENGKFTYDVSGMVSGIYFLRLHSENEIINRKFLIMK